MENNNFLPSGYKTPDNSDYMKFKEGDNAFRILSSAIVGFEYFNTDNKPVRSKESFQSTPFIKKDGKVKHFWAFVVYNYNAEKIQILELTQATLQGSIKALVDNIQWGDPKEYDITVIRKGEGLLTEYSIMPNPKSELAKEIIASYKAKQVTLENLYKCENPFEAGDVIPQNQQEANRNVMDEIAQEQNKPSNLENELAQKEEQS